MKYSMEIGKLNVRITDDLPPATSFDFVIQQVDGLPQTITCGACGRTSANKHDIAQKYCGHCHKFHGEPTP